MKSGEPDPVDDLQLIIDTKRHAPMRTVEVVSKTARWMKAALKGAGIHFTYGSCEEENHYGYASFTIIRKYKGEPVSLELKIAEIGDAPFMFSEVRSLGKLEGTLFPFFGDLSSEEGRNRLLHYVADFVMSTEP
jgi:hypothetical protein